MHNPDYASARSRFAALNGVRPTSPGTLSQIEMALGVTLPAAFCRICEFWDGSGLPTENLSALNVSATPETMLGLTLEHRRDLGLAAQYVVMGSTDEGVLLLDCAPAGSGTVHWIPRARLAGFVTDRPLVDTHSWPTFLDFFNHVLDQEEASVP